MEVLGFSWGIFTLCFSPTDWKIVCTCKNKRVWVLCRPDRNFEGYALGYFFIDLKDRFASLSSVDFMSAAFSEQLHTIIQKWFGVSGDHRYILHSERTLHLRREFRIDRRAYRSKLNGRKNISTHSRYLDCHKRVPPRTQVARLPRWPESFHPLRTRPFNGTVTLLWFFSPEE